MATMKKHNLAFTLIAPAALVITAAHSSLAQDQQKQSWPIKALPEHKVLKQEVGAWDAVVKVWPAPGAEPIESKGTEKNRMLQGGFWLISRFEGEMLGMPLIGMGIFGYDPAEKKYTGTWADTMTPHSMAIKSDYDPKTKTMTGVAETRDPVSGEKYNAKMITRFIDDDNHVMEMHRTDKDGKEFKVMEITYKRAKE